MPVTYYPGTTKRFKPSFLMSVAGGDSSGSALTDWNKRVAPYYRDWVSDEEGTGVGLFKAKIYFSHLAPTNDHSFDWSYLDSFLNLSIFNDDRVTFHWRMGNEGAMPSWFPSAWVGISDGNQKTFNFLNAGAMDWFLNSFYAAYIARYDNDNRVYSVSFDETSLPAGANNAQFQQSLITAVKAMAQMTKHHLVFKFQGFGDWNDDVFDDVHIGSADPKWCDSGCDGNFPNVTIGWGQGAANRHSVVLENTPSGKHLAFMQGSEPNGWRITGNRKLANPWGDDFPGDCPKLTCANGVHPMSHTWALGYKPRAAGTKADSGLGQSGTDPAGLAPASYMYFPGKSTASNQTNSHECETDKMWDDAFSTFGGAGTRACPALPWDWPLSGGGGTGGSSTATATASASWWHPTAGLTWQWQLTTPVDTTQNVNIYDIDYEDNSTAVVSTLHGLGKKVIAYMSVGTWEDFRGDAGDFPAAIKGNTVGGFPDEKWLDIRDQTTLRDIMRARFDLAKAKGFDAVEMDNIDGYTNNPGFSFSAGDQLVYNLWLASAVHSIGLAAFFKNDTDQVNDVVDYYDGCVVEQAFEYGEADAYSPFILQNKPVLEAEYNIATSAFCSDAIDLGFSAIHKNLNLNASVTYCSVTQPPPPDPGCPPAVNASLKVYASFDNSIDFPGQWYSLDQPQGGSWAHEHVTTPTRHGSGSMKSEERDGGRGQKYRAEYLEQPRVNYPGKERWYGFSVFLPSGFSTGPGRCVICQNHGKPTEPGQLWELNVEGNKVKTLLYSGDFEAHKITGDAGTVVTNKWMDFVIHARYRKDASGVFELWRDGKKMFSQNPDTGIGSTQSTQMLIQIGAYSPGWTNNAPGNASPLILYHDEFRLAEGENAYSLVAPECNGSSNPNPPPPPDTNYTVLKNHSQVLVFTDSTYSSIVDPYDLNDGIVFTHTDGTQILSRMYYTGGIDYNATFTPTIVGTWSYGVISGSSKLNGLTGTVECLESNALGFLTKTGNKWKWSNGREFVPQLTQLAEINDYASGTSDLGIDMVDRIDDTGFNGVLVYSVGGRWFHINSWTVGASESTFDQTTFETIEDIQAEAYARGACVVLWWWGSSAQGASPAQLSTGVNGAFDTKLQKYIASRLGPLPGIVHSFGFDADKYMTIPQLYAWRDNINLYIDPHYKQFIGARPAGPNNGQDHSLYDAWNDVFDYASYDHKKPTYATFKAAVEHNTKPVLSEDIFYVRTLDSNDYTETDVYRSLYISTLAGGCGGIYNYVGATSSGPNTSFSKPYLVKNYHQFFYGQTYRFLSGMVADSSIITGNQYAAREGNGKYIFFNQDTTDVILNLSDMSGTQAIIYADAGTSNYTEHDAGNFLAGTHAFTNLGKRDWVFAVGDYSATGNVTATNAIGSSTLTNIVLGRKGSIDMKGYIVEIHNDYPVFPSVDGLVVHGYIPHPVDGAVDYTPPTTPSIYDAYATNATTVVLSWTTSTDTETGVSGYKVYVNGLYKTTVTGTTITIGNLKEDTQYTFYVVAVDGVGNEASSGQAGLRTPLDTSLTRPDLIGSATSHDIIRLKWTMKDADKEKNIKYYVYKDRIKIYTTEDAFSVFRNLDPDTAYTFNVQAYDPDGNISELSQTILLRTDRQGDILKWTELPDRL